MLSLTCTCSGSNRIQATVFNCKLKNMFIQISTSYNRNVFICSPPLTDKLTLPTAFENTAGGDVLIKGSSHHKGLIVLHVYELIAKALHSSSVISLG